MEIKPIAYFHSPFTSKFGVPKQSGLVDNLKGEVVFEPDYRNRDYLRGLEEFDFLWLIWEFSANKNLDRATSVRPPVLGGNKRVGVFATRSPFRPNNIGLSSVKLDYIEWESAQGPILHVIGADLMDGTPIYDIKPYVEYADSHVGIRSGFVDANPIKRLEVEFDNDVVKLLSIDDVELLKEALSLDPRPHYHNSATRIYGMPFNEKDIYFRVEGNKCLVVGIGDLNK